MVWAGSPSRILINSPQGSLRLASQETPDVCHAALLSVNQRFAGEREDCLRMA